MLIPAANVTKQKSLVASRYGSNLYFMMQRVNMEILAFSN